MEERERERGGVEEEEEVGERDVGSRGKERGER